MDDRFEQNRRHWNEITPIHERSAFYDVAGFKAGANMLKSIEREELGDVAGKSLLHLQCHFGMDTLSWARLGATVTGVDLSDESIRTARRLAKETGLSADFVESNLYDLPQALHGTFDIVFTSYGVLWWLPDLRRWAEIAAHFLRPGGTFYIAEHHPVMYTFGEFLENRLRIDNSYFNAAEQRFEAEGGTYADLTAELAEGEIGWSHTLGEVVTALASAGLRIEHVHEFPLSGWQRIPQMIKDPQGYYRLPGDPVPLMFSIKATKPT